MILLGLFLATAPLAEAGPNGANTASIWGSPSDTTTVAVASAPTATHTPPKLVVPPMTTAETASEPVIVPRRLQAAIDREEEPVRAAQATPDQSQLNRLLGDEVAITTPGGPSAVSAAGLGLWWWMLPVMGLLAGANMWLRKKGGLGSLVREEAPLKIISRQSLGGTNQLVLIEVQDPSGQARRMLVGTGANGPRLVSELHPQTDFESLINEAPEEPITVAPSFAQAAQASERLARETVEDPRMAAALPPRPTVVPAPRPTVVPESRPKVVTPPSDPTTYGNRRYRQIDRASTTPARSSTPNASLQDRRREARSLVDEVLASRKESGWSA